MYLDLICSMSNVDINAVDDGDDTPLIACCEIGGDSSTNAAAANVLIRHGANVNYANNEGCTALYYSGRRGHEMLVRLLMEYGADWNQLNEPDHLGEVWTPFCVTIEEGNETSARIMMDAGATLANDQSRPPVASLRDELNCRLSEEGLRCLDKLAPCPGAERIRPGHPRVQW